MSDQVSASPGYPEYLGDEPAPPRRRRTALIAGGVIGGLAVVGGGAWAASWYLGSGASTADVLPAATVAYAEVNLDPSGSQKIAALETLNKFPAFKSVGIGSRDDLREKLFDLVQSDGTCASLDYARDVQPWLGDRAALAAVDEGGDQPVGVGVLEVTDEAAAKTGLQKLATCDGGEADTGFVVQDGWAVLAETRSQAQQAVDLAAKGTLADDDDYQRLTSAAGSTGIATAYVAPGAGDVLADLGAMATATGADSATEDFGGLAAQVRFADGGVEVEYAGADPHGTAAKTLSTDGVDAVTGLPAATGAAAGVALKPGWGDAFLDGVADTLGSLGGKSRAGVVDEIEQTTGLSVPGDLETLLGSSAALAVSAELDVDAAVNSGDLSSVPVGVRIDGDPDAVGSVLDKVRSTTGQTSLLASSSDGDRTGVGPDRDWDAALAQDGTLGDSTTFRDVVPDASRAAMVLYLDADSTWVDDLAGSGVVDDEVADNLKPLKALGAAAWVDGDLVHGRLKITTD